MHIGMKILMISAYDLIWLVVNGILNYSFSEVKCVIEYGWVVIVFFSKTICSENAKNSW